MDPHILLLDIETSPNLAYCWGLWNQNIGIDHLKSTSEMICWAAKWYGKKETIFRSVFHGSKKEMLTTLHKLLDKAEIVVHYNGRTFDIPTINKEFIRNNFNPPSPYKQIDLIETAKRTFRFQSNKLEFVCRELNIGAKEKHEGFLLWKKCLERDPKAWAKMRKYNIKDVVLTEQLYERIRPWIRSHPNLRILVGQDYGCPACLSKNIQRRGVEFTAKCKWQRHQCMDCGTWFKKELLDKVDA